MSIHETRSSGAARTLAPYEWTGAAFTPLAEAWRWEGGDWTRLYSRLTFYDDFERAAIGPGWVVLPGYSPLSIANGELYSPSGQRKMYPDMSTNYDDMTVGMTVGAPGSGTVKGTLHLSMDPAADAADFKTYVHFNFNREGWNSGYRDIDGGYSGPLYSGPWSLVTGDTVTVARQRNTITVSRNDAIQQVFDLPAAFGPGYRHVGVTLNSGCPRPTELWVRRT